MSYGDLEGKLTTPYRRYLRQKKNFDPALPKSFNIDSSPDRTKTFRCRNSKDPHLEGGIGENPVRSRSPGHLLPGAHARPLPAKIFKELRFEAIRGSTEHPKVSHLNILKKRVLEGQIKDLRLHVQQCCVFDQIQFSVYLSQDSLSKFESKTMLKVNYRQLRFQQQ